MACNYHPWLSGPFDWYMQDPPLLLCKSSSQTCLSSCTIITVFHYAFSKNECRFHDQVHLSFFQVYIRMAIWYSFYICLFLGREWHWLVQPNFSRNWQISILQRQDLKGNLWYTNVFLPDQVFDLQHPNMHFPSHILSRSYLKFLLLFSNIGHLALQIILGIFVRKQHFHIQIVDSP